MNFSGYNNPFKILIIKVFILFFIISFGAVAQVRVTIQGTSIVPTGELETYTEVGYGGSVNLSYYPFTTDIEFTLSSGFYHAGLKENLPGYDFDIEFLPVTAGLRYNFADVNVIPFTGAEAGYYKSRYILLIKSPILGNSLLETKEWAFGYAPYAGLRMNLSETLDFEIAAKYNVIITKYVGRGFINIMSGLAYRIW